MLGSHSYCTYVPLYSCILYCGWCHNSTVCQFILAYLVVCGNSHTQFYCVHVYSCMQTVYVSICLKRSILLSVVTVSGTSTLPHSCYILPDPLSLPQSYSCVRQMLVQSPHCPMCKAGLPPQNPIHPNFSRECRDIPPPPRC